MSSIPQLGVIYQPKGRAAEYSPLACNLYLGCTHGCRYCYAPRALHKTAEAYHAQPWPRKGSILSGIETDLKALESAGVRIPVLFSFASDPYQPAELELGLTRRTMELFAVHQYPVNILSKAGLLATRDFDLLPAGSRFGSTLTFVDEEASVRWEPNAALPEERFESLRLAHERGLDTWASLEPVMDAEQTLEIIARTTAFVNTYKIGVLNYGSPDAPIDHRAFLREAIAICNARGAHYYIKEDMRPHLDAGTPPVA